MTILVDDTVFSVSANGTFDLGTWHDAGAFESATLILRAGGTANNYAFAVAESNDKSVLSEPAVTTSGDYHAVALTCRYFKWQVVITGAGAVDTLTYCIGAN